MVAAKERNRLQSGNPLRIAAENRPVGAPHAGFTLIEVLLALAIFSIGLMAVAGMQISSVNKNASSKINTMAVEYASDYMERLLNLGTGTDITENGADDDGDGDIDEADEILFAYDDLDAGDHEPGETALIPVHPEFDTVFDLSWTVADGLSGSGAAVEGPIKIITVTVSWANGNKEVSLTSIKSTVL